MKPKDWRRFGTVVDVRKALQGWAPLDRVAESLARRNKESCPSAPKESRSANRPKRSGFSSIDVELYIREHNGLSFDDLVSGVSGTSSPSAKAIVKAAQYVATLISTGRVKIDKGLVAQ